MPKRESETTVKLTRAQAAALDVLVRAAEKPGGSRVRGSKRRSELLPIPNVNMIAARSLVDMGLARGINPDFERGYVIDHGYTRGMVCEDEYEATAAGIVVGEADHAE